MTYQSILKTKPKKENKQEFCRRICNLLKELDFETDATYYSGLEIVDYLFVNSEFNNGFSSASDLLGESNIKYINLLKTEINENININDILANIEIIINSLFKTNNETLGEFTSENPDNILKLLSISIEEYLISLGYKIIDNGNYLEIVESEIAIDIDSVTDKKVKEDAISYFNYKNTNDIEEKRKIIVNILTKLEAKREKIKKIFGKNIESQLFSYANNVNLRHDNINRNSKKYKNSIAKLTDKELIDWYDYIFAYAINIYMKVDILTDINVSNEYN